MSNTNTRSNIVNKQCPYCGKMFTTKYDAKVYCDKCINAGYHWLHECLGKTNGWNKKAA